MAFWGALALRFKAWSLMIGAIIAAIFGLYFYGRHSGSLKEAQKGAERDRKAARKIENDADNARLRTGDPIDRLRKHQRLRD